MQLARSICWCVVALLPTILLVAFLVGAEAQVSHDDICIGSVYNTSKTFRLHHRSHVAVTISFGEMVLGGETRFWEWPTVCADTGSIPLQLETVRHIILDERTSNPIRDKSGPQLVRLAINRV